MVFTGILFKDGDSFCITIPDLDIWTQGNDSDHAILMLDEYISLDSNEAIYSIAYESDAVFTILFEDNDHNRNYIKQKMKEQSEYFAGISESIDQ